MSQEMHDKGLQVRKKVLGAEYVEKAMANADDFSQPFQDLLNEFCWGAIWGRPGLPLKTRSMLNLAMLTALNRPAELKIHIRGAINNGLTREEIQEVLLHTLAYCGFPATLESFKVAREVLAQIDAEGNGNG